MKPGGNEGGEGAFVLGAGLILCALGTYLFFDSVRVTSVDAGAISGRLGRGGGWRETTSMGVVFVPFLLGIVVLFFDSRKKWAWWFSGLGLAIIAVEIMSRIRFVMEMKTTHLMLILGMVAAGAGLLARAYLADLKKVKDKAKD